MSHRWEHYVISIEKHIDSIGNDIDSHSARYENFILIGNFNTEESDTAIKL